MLRCGQPLTTMAGKRSREDEKLVNATLGNELKGIIVDTRSQAAAMNSRTKGKQNSLSHNLLCHTFHSMIQTSRRLES